MAFLAVRDKPSLFKGPLFLTKHVFLARTGLFLIFLDLREDCYICIDPQYVTCLTIRLGLPPPHFTSVTQIDPANPDAVEEVLAQMVKRRILTRDSRSGKAATLLALSEGIRELPRYGVGGPRVRLRHAAAFLKAVVVANMLLRLGGIESTVRRVSERRTRKAPTEGGQDAESARDLAEIFRKLRPLATGRKDRCLLNSLTLIEFLATFNIFPAWYFGVKMNEFLAHCWVQDGPTVYNDDVENVCDYSVIMRA